MSVLAEAKYTWLYVDRMVHHVMGNEHLVMGNEHLKRSMLTNAFSTVALRTLRAGGGAWRRDCGSVPGYDVMMAANYSSRRC